MIQVTYYYPNGRRSHVTLYANAELAFHSLAIINMDAHAWPVSTHDGLYNWQRDRQHNEGEFSERMRLCLDPEALAAWRRSVSKVSYY